MKNLTVVIAMFVLFLGCNSSTKTHNTNVEEEVKTIEVEDILGRWESSAFLDKGQCKEFFGDEPGVEMEMTVKASDEYIVGGHYNGNADATVRIFSGGEEVSISLNIRISGKWELHDSTLVSINEEGVVTANDDMTQMIFDSSPDLIESFKPIKGESAPIHIISLTKDVMQYKSPDFGDMVILANRVK